MKTSPFMIECCVCHRVRTGSGWRASRSPDSNGPVSHAYCPTCLDKVMGELDLVLGKETVARARAIAG